MPRPEDDPVELTTPYWRIDRTAVSNRDVARALMRAVGPVVTIICKVSPGAVALVVLSHVAIAGLLTALLVLVNRLLAILLHVDVNRETIEASIPTVALLGMIAAARIGLDAVSSVARASLAPRARRAAEMRLYSATLGVDLMSFDEPDFYDRLKRAHDRGILHLEDAITALVNAVGAALSTAGALAALLLIDPILLPLLMAALLPGLWSAIAGARAHFAHMDRTIALTRRSDLYSELATRRAAASEIRANGVAPWVKKEFAQASRNLTDHLISRARKDAWTLVIGSLLSGAGLAFAFLALGALMWWGKLDLAKAGAAIAAMRSAANTLPQLIAGGNTLAEKAVYIDDLENFIKLAESRASARSDLPEPAPPSRIDLKNVSFRYRGAHEWALREIDLSIAAGETIALVGENGSGKSTLAKLIGGLYPATDGLICWDGVDTTQFNPVGLAAMVSTVLQEPVRWPGTARVNIELGRPEECADIERLKAAARQAGADTVVEGLPDGWNTMLSREFRGGRDLSAGQWQRLAIARSLYRDAPIVIWDEPTAPLDARAEVATYRSLRRLGQSRTVILITHRLNSIRAVERIVCLKGGRIAEVGTHDELMGGGGEYARLYKLQRGLE